MVTWSYSYVTEQRSHRSGRNLILDDKWPAGANSKGCACKYAIVQDTSNAVVCVSIVVDQQQCPEVMCMHPCPLGFKKNEQGCQTCGCKSHPCEVSINKKV